MVPQARLVMVPFQQLGFLSCSQQTTLNLATLLGIPLLSLALILRMIAGKLLGEGTGGEVILVCGVFCIYYLSLSPSPPHLPLPSPSLPPPLSETVIDQKQNQTGKSRLFKFALNLTVSRGRKAFTAQ